MQSSDGLRDQKGLAGFRRFPVLLLGDLHSGKLRHNNGKSTMLMVLKFTSLPGKNRIFPLLMLVWPECRMEIYVVKEPWKDFPEKNVLKIMISFFKVQSLLFGVEKIISVPCF